MHGYWSLKRVVRENPTFEVNIFDSDQKIVLNIRVYMKCLDLFFRNWSKQQFHDIINCQKTKSTLSRALLTFTHTPDN